MLRWIQALLFGSPRDHAPATGGVEERRLGQAAMRLAQAKADFDAAKRTWPRDRKAVDRAWRQFRDARCAQISAEMGR